LKKVYRVWLAVVRAFVDEHLAKAEVERRIDRTPKTAARWVDRFRRHDVFVCRTLASKGFDGH
jgi:hypothetical protein